MDSRAEFEREELAAMARQQGGKRVEVAPGVWAWEFPPWRCPHCTAIAGPDAEVQPGCPSPLARHGPVQTREEWRKQREGRS